MQNNCLHIAIVGAGWAGCAAAVTASQLGAKVSLFEASRIFGGRARSLEPNDDHKQSVVLDNGQHILIGAYTETIALMRTIGVQAEAVLERLKLDLRNPNQHGFCMPQSIQNPNIAVLYAILSAKGWSLLEKLHFLQVAAQWKLGGFSCNEQASVADICKSISPNINQNLITPLCLAAFNSLPEKTSGKLFLRVLHDALLLKKGNSDVLLAKTALGKIFPEPAINWLHEHQASVHKANRVQAITYNEQATTNKKWLIHTQHTDYEQVFDCIILACPAWEAARLVQSWLDNTEHKNTTSQRRTLHWIKNANSLQHNPIATTYAWCNTQDCANLAPMQALHANDNSQAQFVFHHPQYKRTNSDGVMQSLLAFVCSNCAKDREALQRSTCTQAKNQLGLGNIEIIQTLIEKRATFLCAPALQRPSMDITPGLLACGDYVEGNYPATLEGAVCSGVAAAKIACKST